jgi:hypothetical protein
VHRDLVRDRVERESLDGLAQEDEVRQWLADCATRGVRERVRGCVETDRESVRARARDVERIAPVSRTEVDDRARECAGRFGDLTDVDVEETLTDELPHVRDVTAR